MTTKFSPAVKADGSLPATLCIAWIVLLIKELLALADEWIAATNDEKEKKALRATKEELLAALDKTGARFTLPSQLEMAPVESRDPRIVGGDAV